jgi:hypothetical protein
VHFEYTVAVNFQIDARLRGPEQQGDTEFDAGDDVRLDLAGERDRTTNAETQCYWGLE